MKRSLMAAVFWALSVVAGYAQSFTLTDIQFSKTVYLADEELAVIEAKYVGRSVTFADLQNLLADVQRLYAQQGILTARAILPPQDIVNGVLRIDLVEATISEVRVAELQRTDPRFVRQTITLTPGEAPDFAALERDLRIYEIAHDVRPIIDFQEGETEGTTVASIRLEEPPFRQWTASVDNFGNAQTGEARASVTGRFASLTRWRDTLSLQAQVSRGAYSGSAAYSRPVDSRGGRVFSTLSLSNSNVISGSFAPVEIESNSAALNIGYRRPFRVRAGSHMMAEVSSVYEWASSSLTNVDLSDVTIADVTAQLGYFNLRPGRSISAVAGLRAGDAEAKEVSLTEGTYWLAFGSFGYLQSLGTSLLLDLGANWQYADGENLTVTRLFAAGGINSVRGYPNNVRSGDSGISIRAQLGSSSAFPVGESDIAVLPFGFVDAAAVKPFRLDGSFNSDQDVLASVGVGLRVSGFENGTGLIMVANPMLDTLGFEANTAKVYAGFDWGF